MCGIIAAFNKKGMVNDDIVNQYEEQYTRGQEGFGIALIAPDKTINVLRACEPTKALVDLYMNKAEAIVMHHRFPTSTANYLDQTHPIKVSNGSLKYDYLVVHNGIISNCDYLKKTHEELGFVYNTAYKEISGRAKFNDSEALAIEVARFTEDQTKEIGVQGSAAFIAIRVSKTEKDKDKVVRIFFGKNEGSPLNLSASNKKIRISSTGEGESVKPFVLYSFSPDSYSFDKEAMPFKALVAPTTAINSTIGFADKESKKSWDEYVKGHSGWSSEDDYDEGYVPRNVALKGENEGTLKERKNVIDTCKRKVAVVMENFLFDLADDNPTYPPEAGTALSEIADALYEAAQSHELITAVAEEIDTPPTTVFNQD